MFGVYGYIGLKRRPVFTTGVMGSDFEVPVFTDTSMGTHLAMAVSPNITSGDFKRELERTHFNCFPELGEIRVYGIMVKRKSCLYHLPESVPIKHAFQGLKGTWFLHTEAGSVCGSDLLGFSNHVAVEMRNHPSNGSNITDPVNAINNNIRSKDKRKRKKRNYFLEVVLWGLLRTLCFSRKSRRRKRVKKCLPKYRGDGVENRRLGRSNKISGPAAMERSGFSASENEEEPRGEWISKMVECSSERSSEVISVTGIIERYFSNLNDMSHFDSPSSCEVTSMVGSWPKESLNFSNLQIGATSQFTAKTPRRMTPSLLSTKPEPRTSRNKLEITEVGKRLVMASNTLGISSSNHRPAISIGGKHSVLDSSLVRRLVYEISDEDE